METLALSIGLGLLVSLIFSELFGLAAGGMVVPGYVALALADPLSVLITVGAGLVCFALVRAASGLVILYGRRRTVLTILVGYLVGALLRSVLAAHLPHDGEAQVVIGYVIPGLIAIWFDRQGVVATTSSMLLASVVVRLSLVLTIGGELGP